MDKIVTNKIVIGILSLFCIGYPFYSWIGTWCLLSLFAIWVFNKFNYPWTQFANRLHWPFVGFFLLHLLGLIFSSDIQEGINDLQSKSALLIIPIVFATIQFKKSEISQFLRLFLYGVIATSFIYISYAAYQFIFLEANTDVFFYANLTTPFKSHPAYTASYSIFGIVYLLNLYFQKSTNKRWSKFPIWNSIAIVFLWGMIIIYAGRMQILAGIIIVILQLIWELGKRKNFAILGISVLAIFGFTFAVTNSMNFVKERVERAEKSISSAENIRYQLWNASFELILEHPLIGVGTGDIKSEQVVKYKELGYKRALRKKLNAHNQYLETFGALGIVGLISYLLLLFVPAMRAIQHGNYVILAFCLIFVFGTLTECMLETQKGSVWLAVFGSLFWGRENFLDEQST